MLNRAATNAYSWWWASHIRTKQSKWLEQNLIDMEGMVESMMKIIDQEGDSFVKRVEMYYKKRPELIHFVEESYRAYRALAERYDYLSKDLQNANRTIATAFPEQIQLSMESYEDTSSNCSISPSPDSSEKFVKTIPTAPKNLLPRPQNKAKSTLVARKEHLRRTASNLGSVVPANSSGLTKEEAIKEIDVLQKDILAKQTEKEFLKSSYEAGMAKFWEIEGKISELHARVYNLQDEFGVGTVIEDQEARSLMATTALSSCSEALNKIQAKRDLSTNEVKGECVRLKEAHMRLETLKKRIVQEHKGDEPKSPDVITGDIELEEGDDSLRSKIKEKLSVDSNTALTEPELAEKVDELVQKIVDLETNIFSQNGMLNRIRQYTDELLNHISSLEENAEVMDQHEDNTKRVLELEDELSKVKSLNQDLLNNKKNLNIELAEANINLDHLMVKIEDVKKNEGVEESAKDEPEVETVVEVEVEAETEHHDQEKKESLNSETNDEVQDKEGFSWKKMYTTNMEERERIFVEEYSIILRDYKDNKVKLSEVEKKNQEYIFELTSLARELRNTIVSKDKEIKLLVSKLNALQHNNTDNADPDQLDGSATPKRSNHHDRSVSADESRSQWGFESDKKPLFHHLYDPRTGILARSTNNSVENSPRIRDPLEDSPRPLSRIQARLRTELNNVLEGNLEFWLRFSTSFHQIQKFEATIKDLNSELSKLRESKNKQENNKLNLQGLQSDARPLYKHMREIQTEMTLWMEHSSVFQDELRTRFLSMNNIQEEIAKLLVAGKKSGDPELSDFQAAKFQGEILNMKQENNKVDDELQTGIRKVKDLKKETDKELVKLDKEFKLCESKLLSSKSRIPLHTILFGMKLKKNKHKNLTPLG